MVATKVGRESGACLGAKVDRPLSVAQAELGLSQVHLHPRHTERVVGRVAHQLGRRRVQPLGQASGEGQALDIAVLFVQVPEDREQDLVGLVLLPQTLLGDVPCRLASNRARVVPMMPPTRARSTSEAAITRPRFLRMNFLRR